MDRRGACSRLPAAGTRVYVWHGQALHCARQETRTPAHTMCEAVCTRDASVLHGHTFAFKCMFNMGLSRPSAAVFDQFESEYRLLSDLLPRHDHTMSFYGQYVAAVPDHVLSEMPEFVRNVATVNPVTGRRRRSPLKTQWAVFEWLPVTLGGWARQRFQQLEAAGIVADALPWRDVAEKALDVARGLRHLEEHSVVHRDLKMDNVMVASDGRAVLADFGTAVEVCSDGSVHLRQGQSVGGNTAHLAPEVHDAASRIAHAAHDTAVHVPYGRQPVFALGVLMTELATGEHPIPAYPSSVEVRGGGYDHATGGRGSRFAYRLPSRPAGGDDVNPSGGDGGGAGGICNDNDGDGDSGGVVEGAVELPEEYPAPLRALSRRMLSCDPAARPSMAAVVTALEALLARAGKAQCVLEDPVAAYALQATNARLAADNARCTAAASRGGVVTPRDVHAEIVRDTDGNTDGNTDGSGADAEATVFLAHVQQLDTLLSAHDDTDVQCDSVAWEEGVASLERLLQAAGEARLHLDTGNTQSKVTKALDAFTNVLQPAGNLSKYVAWRSVNLQLTQRGAAALVGLVKHAGGAAPATMYVTCMAVVSANSTNKVSIAEAGGIVPVVAALARHGDNSSVCEAACSTLRNLGERAANQVTIAEAGGIAPIVTALTRHGDNSAVCEAACGALRNLGTNAANKVSMAEAGGIVSVVAALARHGDNSAVCEAACHALWILALHTANRVSIAEAGGIVPVVTVLTTHADSSGVCEAACSALRILALSTTNRVSIAEAGGIVSVVAALTRHGGNSGVCEAACGALRTLGLHTANQVSIAEAGGIAPVVVALTRHGDNSHVCKVACGVLRNLGANASNKVSIAEAGAVAPVVAALMRHGDNIGVCESACHALWILALHAANQVTIAEAGGIVAVIAALTRHGDNSGVCEAACHALWGLAMHAANQVAMAEAGGIAPVVAALTRHGDNSGVCEAACGALRNLALHTANQVAIAEAGGIAPVVVALRRHGDNSDVCKVACRALWSLAMDATNQVVIAEAGGIGPVVAALATHIDNSYVCEAACGALCRLALRATNKMSIAEAGGIAPVAAALTRHGDNSDVRIAARRALRSLGLARRNR